MIRRVPRAWTPLLLIAAGCGDSRAILVLPSDTANAKSALISVESRVYAVDLAAPAVVTIDAEAPATVDAVFLESDLAALRLSAGPVLDTPGGDTLPNPVLAMRAAIDGGGSAEWTIDPRATRAFDTFHTPPAPPTCTELDVEVVSTAAFSTMNPLIFAEPSGPSHLYLGTQLGEVYRLSTALAVEPIAIAGGERITGMFGDYVSDDLGRIGRITSRIDTAQPIEIAWEHTLPDVSERIAQIVVSRGGGEIAALTLAGTVWLLNTTGWHRVHRFPIVDIVRGGLRIDEDTRELQAISSKARYLLEVPIDGDAPFATRTTTIAAKNLAAIVMLNVGGVDALYIGDAIGGIWKRDDDGRWSLFADTQIGDPICDLFVDMGVLIYIGNDGWAGTIVPEYGLCQHGPIMPSTDLGAALAGRRIYFGEGYVVRLRTTF